MSALAIADKIFCPRECGARFLRQPFDGMTVLHECPRTAKGEPFKAKTQRAEIEIIVGGADAGREAGTTVRSSSRTQEKEEAMPDATTVEDLLPSKSTTETAILDALNGNTAPLEEIVSEVAKLEAAGVPQGVPDPQPIKEEEPMATATATKKAAPKKAAPKKKAAAKTAAPKTGSPSTAKFGEGAKVKVVASGWSVRGWMLDETGVVLSVGRARISVKFDKKATRDKLGAKVGADGGFGVRPECLSIVR